jgi:hypothetical protein
MFSSDQEIAGVSECLVANRTFPLVCTPSSHLLNLAALIQEHKLVLEEKLARHGAILFRGTQIGCESLSCLGFDIPTPSDFNAVVTSFGYGTLL